MRSLGATAKRCRVMSGYVSPFGHKFATPGSVNQGRFPMWLLRRGFARLPGAVVTSSPTALISPWRCRHHSTGVESYSVSYRLGAAPRAIRCRTDRALP